MSLRPDLAARTQLLRDLHHGDLLVLPNAWDVASAKLVVAHDFPVVATASNAIAATLGYADGEGAPWQEMFAVARRMVEAVDVPVTVDAEAGYGLAPRELVDRLVELGAAGCNLEDGDHRNGGLVDAGLQAERLAAVRAAAVDAGVPLVVNARVDVFRPPAGVAPEDRVAEAVRRGRLYREAGADCIYPIGVRARADLAALLDGLPGPVNANVSDELTLPVLRELGAARVSFGPSLFWSAQAHVERELTALRAGRT